MKIIRKLNIYKDIVFFFIRKTMLGFEYGNISLTCLEKSSIVPILKKYGARIGKNCDFESGITFHNCSDYTNLRIGNDCHIGKNCFFDLKEKITIGNNVTISMNNTLLTHTDLGKSSLSSFYPETKASIFIDDNAYIGARCIILEGVRIKKNSVIAAGSVVIDSVEENSLYGGVPASKIKDLKK